MADFHAYLFFSGDCREAMTRYQEIMGGQLDIMTMGDMPPGNEMPGAEPHHVMHAALTIGDALLMASDDPTGDGGPKTGMCVHFTGEDVDDAQRVFDTLAEGGEVQMPFAPVFWAPGFGALVDRFGVPWMVSAPGVEGAMPPSA